MKYLPKGRTINVEYYISLLDTLPEALKRQGRTEPPTTEQHIQQHVKIQKILDFSFELIDHPPYFPNLDPFEYHISLH